LKKIQRGLVHLLCAAALISLAWLMWKTGDDFLASGETTAQLKILKAPFIYGMGLLCGFTGLVHLSMMLKPLDHEETEGGAL
jgi:TRAP-type C4-dicarboxylate transport system permease small subunit